MMNKFVLLQMKYKLLNLRTAHGKKYSILVPLHCVLKPQTSINSSCCHAEPVAFP